jgi:RNA polymerase sigma-70 factor (ECF subfamily)
MMLDAQVIAAARAAWPDVEVSDEAFSAFVAARLDGAVKLEDLCLPDMYLACACLDRDPIALDAFDAILSREVELASAKIVVLGGDAGDLKQSLRARLLVGDGVTPGKLAEYGGRGNLKGWLRVIAVRDVIQLKRKHGREQPLPEADLLVLPETSDPALERLKLEYRGEFQKAFLDALASLSSKERNLLRSRFLHRLGVDDLAPLLGVHRATVARWLVKAQETLREQTLLRLSERLDIGASEIQSVVRLIHSQIDMSLSRVFSRSSVQE